jgi:dTDP-4-dehydrorhamnose reductase
MRILVYGAAGWIGQQFLRHTAHTVIIGTERPDNYDAAVAEITKVNPDAVCSFLGRTHGPGSSTIDYLEQPGRLYENMRDNFVAPIHLAQICESLHIQFIYLGTGCIYTYDADKRLFSEEDAPNFFGSAYSIMKGFTNTEMARFAHTLHLRIRMPISREVSGRNFIDKLVSYPNICSIPNSMTVLDDMWPIIDRMIDRRTTGTYNMVNPGLVEHNWVLEQYKSILDPTHVWTSVSYDEQMQFIKSHRSNNELTTTKLEAFCSAEGLPLPGIKDSIVRCLEWRRVHISG